MDRAIYDKSSNSSDRVRGPRWAEHEAGRGMAGEVFSQ